MSTWTYTLAPVPASTGEPSNGAAGADDGPVRDLRLDDDGDLYLADGDLDLTRGGLAAKQGATIRTKHFLGDWFLDTSTGIPYFTRILIKSPNLSEVREWLRLAIVDTPDIAALYTMRLGFVRGTRSLEVSYHAATANGAKVLSKVSVP